MLNKKSTSVKEFFLRRLKMAGVLLTLAALLLTFASPVLAESGEEQEDQKQSTEEQQDQQDQEKMEDQQKMEDMQKDMHDGETDNEGQNMDRSKFGPGNGDNGEHMGQGSEMNGEMSAKQCSSNAASMEKEFAHQTEYFDRQLSNIGPDFGMQAEDEFNTLVEKFKSAQEEMLTAAKACDFETLQSIQEGSMSSLQMEMGDFWEKWGDVTHANFEEDRCAKIQENIARVESEKLASVPAAQLEKAKGLLEKAKGLAAKCDFEGLHALEKESRKLGFNDGNGDEGIHGYSDIKSEDLKGFEGHEDDVERSFKGMNARDKNMVFDKLNKADRSSLDKILSDEDADFKDSKIRFLKHADSVEQANSFLEDNADIKALLDEVAALKAEVKALRSEIEKYNFYGDGADTIKEALEDESLSETDRKALIEKAKMESRNGKYRDHMIPFMDTDDDTYFVDAVKNLADEGVVSGRSEGVYDPGSSTTIAEAVKVILETLDYGFSEGDTGVEQMDKHWAKGYFKKLQELNISIPMDNLNRPITRGELADLIVRIKGLSYENLDTPAFSDLGADHPYYKAIQTLNAKGVFNGSNGKAMPDASLNRADVATFMNNVLENL